MELSLVIKTVLQVLDVKIHIVGLQIVNFEGESYLGK